MWIILGILDLIACGSLVIVLSSLDWYESAAFTWGLPMIIAAIVALICGIYTLKRRSWRWAVAGLMTAGAAGIYIWILLWVHSWTIS